MFHNKKGQGGIGLLGFIVVALVIDLAVIYFAGSIGSDITTKGKVLTTSGVKDASTQDCLNGHYVDVRTGETLTNLQVAIRPPTSYNFVCDEYKEQGFGINILTGIGSFPILGGIILILSVAIVTAIIILFLHGSG